MAKSKQINPRELVQGAVQNLAQVATPLVRQIANAPLTEAEQLREYDKVRGDPAKTAQKVLSMMQQYQQEHGAPLGVDPLTAARQWETAMETLRAKRGNTNG